MQENINKHIADLEENLRSISINSEEELEIFRLKYLSSKGKIKQLFESFSALSPEEKKHYGKTINDAKEAFEHFYKTQKKTLEKRHGTAKKKHSIDFSLPSDSIKVGGLHPITIIKNQICDIFKRVGFSISEGPEIDDDWHNFEALNIPKHHPSRDMQDTFFLSKNPDYVLRTHTSNIQIREMKKGKLPLQIICPGKVFRNESVSARAHYFFHQIEGLVVNRNVSFSDLKTILYYFVNRFFGKTIQTRFRPSYFPFTEPSAEMDITCLICQGKKCNVCKYTGWLEILGCGLIHPNVLKNCGIDSEKYSGYAFGMGIERIAMLKYQIKDLRLFSQNHFSFLKQFH